MNTTTAANQFAMAGLEHRPSQCEVIYRLLRRAYPSPVTLPSLHATNIADRNTRIFELRRIYKLDIRNRRWRENGKVCSDYTLALDSEMAAEAFGYSSALPPNPRFFGDGEVQQ